MLHRGKEGERCNDDQCQKLPFVSQFSVGFQAHHCSSELCCLPRLNSEINNQSLPPLRPQDSPDKSSTCTEKGVNDTSLVHFLILTIKGVNDISLVHFLILTASSSSSVAFLIWTISSVLFPSQKEKKHQVNEQNPSFTFDIDSRSQDCCEIRPAAVN